MKYTSLNTSLADFMFGLGNEAAKGLAGIETLNAGSSIGSPNKSHCITELSNGGFVLSSPPDETDDMLEARR